MRATEISPGAFDREAPCSVEDRGDAWVVISRRTVAPGLVAPRRIVLRKSDAGVLDERLHSARGLPGTGDGTTWAEAATRSRLAPGDAVV